MRIKYVNNCDLVCSVVELEHLRDERPGGGDLALAAGLAVGRPPPPGLARPLLHAQQLRISDKPQLIFSVVIGERGSVFCVSYLA